MKLVNIHHKELSLNNWTKWNESISKWQHLISIDLQHNNMLDTEHMVVAFFFYENGDFNPLLVINFSEIYLVSNLTFQMIDKEEYMTNIVDGECIRVHLQSYGCIFSPIYIPLNNSQN